MFVDCYSQVGKKFLITASRSFSERVKQWKHYIEQNYTVSIQRKLGCFSGYYNRIFKKHRNAIANNFMIFQLLSNF